VKCQTGLLQIRGNMSKRSRKHQWDKSKIPELADHSEAKHLILSAYIQKYLAIVCQSRKIREYNITLIDGFSGGGMYKNGKYGSPLVMIDAVSKAVFNINKNREEHVEIKPNYFFIEKDSENYDSLINVVTEQYVKHKYVNSINGDFNSNLPQIITHIKKRNPRGGGGAIFFLDQDGYAAVPIKVLNTIRKELPKAEIIININITWLIDFIEDSDRFRNTIINMGLSRYLDINEVIELKKNIKDNRSIIEARLSVALQQAAGFPYFRPFFIEPFDNHRGYWLLHLSPHYRAHNAMSEVIWENGNYMRHYGGDGAKILELSYKGGVNDTPDIFGSTFNDQAKDVHLEGLVRDLPDIIWKQDQMTVSSLMENTCNNTAASREMYNNSILSMRDQGDIIILGKAGGKKRSNTINPTDILTPQRQQILI